MSEESKSTNPFRTTLIVLLTGFFGFLGGVFVMGLSDGWNSKENCWQVAGTSTEGNSSFVKINTCTGETFGSSTYAGGFERWQDLREEEE